MLRSWYADMPLSKAALRVEFSHAGIVDDGVRSDRQDCSLSARAARPGMQLITCPRCVCDQTIWGEHMRLRRARSSSCPHTHEFMKHVFFSEI